MGIKNLAFCDVEVSYEGETGHDAAMNVLRWEKIDLVESTRVFRSHLLRPKDSKKAAEKEVDEEIDPYSLSVLSATAYKLVKEIILTGQPDIILIEKQRWRSSGGSAIQQWTVRVNTLEGMLWAILETLRLERRIVLPRLRDVDDKRDYEVFAVDPKRVGQYWLQQDAQALGEMAGKRVSVEDAQDSTTAEVDANPSPKKKLPRSKAEKKAKINIVRSWLSTTLHATIPSAGTSPVITFDFTPSADKTRRALCCPTPTSRRKSSKSNDDSADTSEKEMKKLDDVTDCFLQAAAWVSWESHRLQLMDVWREYGGGVGSVEEEALREMVEKSQGGGDVD